MRPIGFWLVVALLTVALVHYDPLGLRAPTTTPAAR
jgi:hypothetical protein